MTRLLSNPRNILPSTMVVGVLALGLRIGDVWQMAAYGNAPHADCRSRKIKHPMPNQRMLPRPMFRRCPQRLHRLR